MAIRTNEAFKAKNCVRLNISKIAIAISALGTNTETGPANALNNGDWPN